MHVPNLFMDNTCFLLISYSIGLASRSMYGIFVMLSFCQFGIDPFC